jgi:hypothetical protein
VLRPETGGGMISAWRGMGDAPPEGPPFSTKVSSGWRALAELEETHETARRNLESLSQRREKIVELEREKDALLDSYAA